MRSQRRPESSSVPCRVWFAFVALAWAGIVEPASAADAKIDSLESLMHELALTDSMRAEYTEEKHLALLSEPLESEGVIVFVRPDRFARHTLRPGKARLVIRGDELLTSDETGEDRVDLSQSDVAKQLVGSLVDVLGGNQAALQANYEVAFQAAGSGAWSLQLSPRSSRVARFVEVIDIEGVGREVASMALREPNGDRTVTRFRGFETGLGLSEAELDALFSAARRTQARPTAQGEDGGTPDE